MYNKQKHVKNNVKVHIEKESRQFLVPRKCAWGESFLWKMSKNLIRHLQQWRTWLKECIFIHWFSFRFPTGTLGPFRGFCDHTCHYTRSRTPLDEWKDYILMHCLGCWMTIYFVIENIIMMMSLSNIFTIAVNKTKLFQVGFDDMTFNSQAQHALTLRVHCIFLFPHRLA
jgi:hypothetical protein